MKAIIFLFCIGLVLGCSSSSQNDPSIIQPVLLERYPLPAIPLSVADASYFTLKTRVQIDEQGYVNQIKLLNSIGDVTWDSLAVTSIRKWRFSPAIYNNKPYKVWVMQKIAIRVAEPVYLWLAEILCDTYDDAAKVCESLKQGKDFGELASQISTDSSGKTKGVLGMVDINRYPEEIGSTLRHLKVNECTKPLKYGRKYAIFKRLEEGVLQ